MGCKLLIAILLVVQGAAFQSRWAATTRASVVASSAVDRRGFFSGVLTASVLGAGALVVPPAFADGELSDLGAPSDEEQARIAAKLALQKKAGKAAAINRKQSFSEALKAEQAKEKDLGSKSKAEKREDLCDLLGRGC
mmetsp:Transcript_70238/g.158822  ORF Transcript_70238/g.158822 Transcript_70238/m.158822 type:complete len:138 (+) Transcript_70238:23-436(+)